MADPERVLKTERLALESMSLGLITAVGRSDWSAAARLLGAEFPEEWRHGAWSWLPDWIASVDRGPDLVGWGPRLLVVRHENGSRTIVGEAGFHGPPTPGGVAEFGYMVVTAERRRGYAEEAVRALLTWAECQPAVRIFRATVDPDNSASISLLRKLGFTEAGRERHAQRGEEVVFLRRVE